MLRVVTTTAHVLSVIFVWGRLANKGHVTLWHVIVKKKQQILISNAAKFVRSLDLKSDICLFVWLVS